MPAAELDAVVDATAAGIAALPEGVVAGVKAVLSPTRPVEGYLREEAEWADLISRPATGNRMREALRRGVQTRSGEADL